MINGPTGRYRVRKSFFGKSILQSEIEGPGYTGGVVDSSIRVIRWYDCDFKSTSHRLFKQIQQ